MSSNLQLLPPEFTELIDKCNTLLDRIQRRRHDIEIKDDVIRGLFYNPCKGWQVSYHVIDEAAGYYRLLVSEKGNILVHFTSGVCHHELDCARTLYSMLDYVYQLIRRDKYES